MLVHNATEYKEKKHKGAWDDSKPRHTADVLKDVHALLTNLATAPPLQSVTPSVLPKYIFAAGFGIFQLGACGPCPLDASLGEIPHAVLVKAEDELQVAKDTWQAWSDGLFAEHEGGQGLECDDGGHGWWEGEAEWSQAAPSASTISAL
ncbi:hypothetical protein CYMTET_52700 [Cymbomonas tetramitiformis]|uniref:Uncharacterized protein n=1 Tax=Cymbomonas tetramitiformis TaxID=36881 RepID=A0AAE0BJM7_9CHLO|nr:hypothetical protein CYMTET_52700 [Cymbomonas tetramitiformis]